MNKFQGASVENEKKTKIKIGSLEYYAMNMLLQESG